MSEKRITTCDCGCKKRSTGAKAANWFNLNHGYGFSRDKNPIIEGTLNFSSLECLRKWVASKN